MFILIHRKGRQERKDNSILASLNSEKYIRKCEKKKYENILSGLKLINIYRDVNR